MAGFKVTPFKNATNEEILNAIRNTASNDYRSRVPDATRGNISATADRIWEFQATRNEFISAFVNRIGLVVARNTSWTNILAKYKIGMLTQGDTIEEVGLGLAKAYVYDENREAMEAAIFGTETVEARSAFHKINRQNYYKISVNELLLRRAFLEEGGLSKFISDLMAVPSTSDNWDEFLIMTNLFREYEQRDGFFKVNVPDVSAPGSTEADAKAFLRAVRAMAGKLTFLDRNFNAAHLPAAAKVDDLELFITPEASAAIDVEALAAAFNVDRAAVPSRTTIIPQEKFNIPGAQAVLTTRDFFMVADTFYQTTEAFNPVTVQNNYFLHHHQIVSVSPFVPAILFTTGEGSTITITDDEPTTITQVALDDGDGNTITEFTRGDLHQVTYKVTTDPAGGQNDAVKFSLSGATSQTTRVSGTGAVYVGIDETATALTVTVTAAEDDSVTMAKEFTVKATPAAVKLWGGEVSGETDPENPAP